MDTDRFNDARDETLIKRRPWYVLAAALLVLSAITRQPIAFLAAVFALVIGLVPELWYRYALRDLVIRQRISQKRAFFEEAVMLSLSVENQKLLPLPWLEAEDEIPIQLPLLTGRALPTYKVNRVALVNTFSLLSERWREWWNRRMGRKRTTLSLEPLGPGSARAHYREKLQAIATHKGELAKAPAETPLEYEVRLLAHLEKETAHSLKLSNSDDGVSEISLLDELTNAYSHERYGGKRIDDHQRSHLQTWVPRLTERLTGRASTRASSPGRTDKQRPGERANT